MADLENLLWQLVELKTVTKNKGENLQALKWILSKLEGRKIKSEIKNIKGSPVLWWGCRWSESERMVNTHIDVVPASDNIFKASISDGWMYGRGAADTKSSIAVLMDMDKNTVDIATRKGITFCIVCDEEIGGETSKELIKINNHIKFGLFLEPTQLRIVNEAKGIMQVKITARGKSAHGSRLWDGENAIINLAERLVKFNKLNPLPSKETKLTTYNLSQIQGGQAINQVPDECDLLVDIRYHPNDKSKEILNRLRECFKPNQVEVMRIESPIQSDENTTDLINLKSCMKHFNVKPIMAFDYGSSDARHCTAAGISSAVFGPIGESLHGNGEKVNLESVRKVKDILSMWLKTPMPT